MRKLLYITAVATACLLPLPLHCEETITVAEMTQLLEPLDMRLRRVEDKLDQITDMMIKINDLEHGQGKLQEQNDRQQQQIDALVADAAVQDVVVADLKKK